MEIFKENEEEEEESHRKANFFVKRKKIKHRYHAHGWVKFETHKKKCIEILSIKIENNQKFGAN